MKGSRSLDVILAACEGSSVHGILQARILKLGCHFLLQGIFPSQGSNSRLLYLLHWQEDSLPTELTLESGVAYSGVFPFSRSCLPRLRRGFHTAFPPHSQLAGPLCGLGVGSSQKLGLTLSSERQGSSCPGCQLFTGLDGELPAQAGKGGPRLQASLQGRHPMRMGWGPRGSEQAGRASRLLPVKRALGLDAAFVPGVESLGCCSASPVR